MSDNNTKVSTPQLPKASIPVPRILRVVGLKQVSYASTVHSKQIKARKIWV
jgi:hypothetical protein